MHASCTKIDDTLIPIKTKMVDERKVTKLQSERDRLWTVRSRVSRNSRRYLLRCSDQHVLDLVEMKSSSASMQIRRCSMHGLV